MGLEDMLSSAWWSHSHADRCQPRRWVRQTPLIYWLLHNGPYLHFQSVFLLYYGCGSPYWMSFLKTMTVTGPADSQDHKNQFRSLLHVLFLTDLSVYFPSLVLNEPSDSKHYSGWSCWCNCEVCVLNFLLTSKWKNEIKKKEGVDIKKMTAKEELDKWRRVLSRLWWSRLPLLVDAVTTPSGSNDRYSNLSSVWWNNYYWKQQKSQTDW